MNTRRNRLIREYRHNSYRPKGKLAEPVMCGDCGAHFHNGRWAWGEVGAVTPRFRCEACRRIAEDFPAGELRLSGGFLESHGEEVQNLVRNVEEAEKSEHPLHRIMDMTGADGGIVIRTTDTHLPRRIGDALFRAYDGELEVSYDRGGNFVRAEWRRGG